MQCNKQQGSQRSAIALLLAPWQHDVSHVWTVTSLPKQAEAWLIMPTHTEAFALGCYINSAPQSPATTAFQHIDESRACS